MKVGETDMYYVLQVAPGEEDKTERHIMVIIPDDLYKQCFHPTRHMRKKFHGKWVDTHEKLLPGYVFITTENAKELFLELKKVPMLTKLVGRDEEYFVKLPEQDVEWLEKFMSCGGQKDSRNASAKTGAGSGEMAADSQKYEVGLSQISIDEGNEIRIVSGPLKNMEGMIRKIHLHRRVAEVEVPFMNRRTVIYLGIELLERK